MYVNWNRLIEEGDKILGDRKGIPDPGSVKGETDRFPTSSPPVLGLLAQG